MKLKVIRWDEANLIHICEKEDGDTIRVDLWVDGSLDKRYKNSESLVGKTVEVERLHTYEYIANNVKIIKNNNL